MLSEKDLALFPLIEKYRPQTFGEVIGVKDIGKLTFILSNPATMPNLLFFGPQGTGKTTCAKIIIASMRPIDVMRINGSDTTGIDTIRDKVFNFVTSKSSVDGKPKIVWIEEFDYMSQAAFAALRSMIEQYFKNARYICTCNYIYKVPEAIQSRFSLFEFHKPTDKELIFRLKFICELEKIQYKDEELKRICDYSKGDIRTAINILQKISSNEEKTIKIENIEEIENLSRSTYDKLLNREWLKIRYEVPTKHPDYEKMLVEIEDLFFKSDIDVEKKAKITEIISTGQMEMAFSFDNDICFAAICSRIIKEL
jgi:DNA polymerase III delta prime subunit